MRVTINRGLDGKFQKITEDLEEFGQIYGQMAAEDLVKNSPVDTGTFMDSYYAGVGYTGSFNSSKGKPRKQPWAPYAQEAIGRMSSQVSSLRGSTQMVFGNSAEHALQVEYDHGYRPFGKAEDLHADRVRRAWAEAKR
jgi:hypothetical protein